MMRDWLIGTAKRKPEALLVLAAGCAMLMRNGSRDRSGGGHTARSEDRGRMPRRAAEVAGDYASDIKDRVSEAASSASDAAQPYVSSASEYIGDVRRTIADQTSRLTDRMPSSIGQFIREQPVAIVTLGAAAGATLAALFPKTEIEERALGPARSAVSGAAGAVKENLMDAATHAGEHLKQGAVERGLSSEGLKDLAREAASTFTSEISGTSDRERKGTHGEPAGHGRSGR
jgi:ElaB/YqjD/DUF883 family membrane-anchored ribosome-binding protein